MTYTQPICERCWINDNTTIEPDGVTIRRPALIGHPEIERCCLCGEPTVVGIYTRRDPHTVPYPTGETR